MENIIKREPEYDFEEICPLKSLYDMRQYDRAMDGCYMEIVKC